MFCVQKRWYLPLACLAGSLLLKVVAVERIVASVALLSLVSRFGVTPPVPTCTPLPCKPGYGVDFCGSSDYPKTNDVGCRACVPGVTYSSLDNNFRTKCLPVTPSEDVHCRANEDLIPATPSQNTKCQCKEGFVFDKHTGQCWPLPKTASTSTSKPSIVFSGTATVDSQTLIPTLHDSNMLYFTSGPIPKDSKIAQVSLVAVPVILAITVFLLRLRSVNARSNNINQGSERENAVRENSINQGSERENAVKENNINQGSERENAVRENNRNQGSERETVREDFRDPQLEFIQPQA